MTPFGFFMRKLRIDKGLLLKDVATLLDVSSAYLSALEHGKKGSPGDALIDTIETRLHLDSAQRRELRDAVRDSTTTLSIPSKVTPRVFQTAHAFARRLPDLSDRELQMIDAILKGKGNS